MKHDASLSGAIVALGVLDAGILAAWWIQLAYIVLLSTGLYVRWRRGRWMSIRLVEPASAPSSDPLPSTSEPIPRT